MTDTPMPKKLRDRSPSFPFIPLKAAIDRLEEFDRTFGRTPPPADKVYIAWGYKGDTSQAQQTLAALKSFGMVSYQGTGPKREVVVTELARNYLRANQQNIKDAALKQMALAPAFMNLIWEKWGPNRHPDAVCLDELVFQHKVNENSAPTFLRVYDETVQFANLDSSEHQLNEEDPQPDDTPPNKPQGNGFVNIQNPKVEKATKPLAEEEREISSGMLSKKASFRLIVRGPIGKKELERLIAKLELDKEILADDDDLSGDEISFL